MSDDSSSSDGEVAGTVAEPSPVRVAALPKRAAARTTTSRGEDDHRACVLCAGADGLTNGGDTYRGKPVHPQCKNAIRSFGRLATGDRRLRETSDKEFYTDIEAWRARIKPLLTAPGERRTPAQRAMVRQQAEETFVSEEVVRDTLRLPLPRYVAYRTFWDRISERQAEKSFWDEVEAQGSSHENSDGEPTVALRDNARSRTTTGKRKRAITTTTLEDTTAPSIVSSLSVAGESGRKRRRDDSDCEASLAGDEDEDAGSVATSRRRTTPKCDRTGSRSDFGRARSLRGDDDDKGGCQEKRQVHMLQARSDLAKEVKASFEDIMAARGAYSTLKKKFSKLSDDFLDLLDGNPASILKDVETQLVAPMQDMCNSMAKLPLREVEAKKAAGLGLIRHVRCAPPSQELFGGVVHASHSVNEVKGCIADVGAGGCVFVGEGGHKHGCGV